MASNTDRRLDRLFPALSARERASLLLKHYKAGTKPPHSIMSMTPPQQVRELNRLIGLMNVVNCELTFGLMTISAQVTQVEIKHGWLMSLGLCIDEMDEFAYIVLQQAQEAKLKCEMKKLVDRLPGQITLPVDLSGGNERRDGEHSIDRLLRGLVDAIKAGTEQNWRELRAVDIGVEEVAEEFDGEDPLKADGRAMLDGAKARCQQLREDMRFYVEFELPEPADAEVELVRKLIESAAKA